MKTAIIDYSIAYVHFQICVSSFVKDLYGYKFYFHWGTFAIDGGRPLITTSSFPLLSVSLSSLSLH